MNRREYEEIGKEKNLPVRCPILDRCGRWAWTRFFFGELDKNGRGKTFIDRLKNEGWVDVDFENRMIYSGEEVIFKKSDTFL